MPCIPRVPECRVSPECQTRVPECRVSPECQSAVYPECRVSPECQSAVWLSPECQSAVYPQSARVPCVPLVLEMISGLRSRLSPDEASSFGCHKPARCCPMWLFYFRYINGDIPIMKIWNEQGSGTFGTSQPSASHRQAFLGHLNRSYTSQNIIRACLLRLCTDSYLNMLTTMFVLP